MTGRMAGPAQDALEAQLRGGAEQLGVVLTDLQVAQLLQYLDLLQKWGKVYNLTAVREPAQMVSHHLLDSLAIVAPLGRERTVAEHRLLDVGSGAGLPGAVIAICCPEIAVDCVDTVAKKAAFVQQVAASLQLPNLKGIHARVESLTGNYDTISARAFASLPDLVAWSADALREGGVWLAMKGKRPDAEIAVLPQTVRVFHVELLRVPGLDADRCIVWMRRSGA